MKQWNVQEKGKRHTREIIDADDAYDAKLRYIAKNNLDVKVGKIVANINLSELNPEMLKQQEEMRARRH